MGLLLQMENPAKSWNLCLPKIKKLHTILHSETAVKLDFNEIH